MLEYCLSQRLVDGAECGQQVSLGSVSQLVAQSGAWPCDPRSAPRLFPEKSLHQPCSAFCSRLPAGRPTVSSCSVPFLASSSSWQWFRWQGFVKPVWAFCEFHWNSLLQTKATPTNLWDKRFPTAASAEVAGGRGS